MKKQEILEIYIIPKCLRFFEKNRTKYLYIQFRF